MSEDEKLIYGFCYKNCIIRSHPLLISVGRKGILQEINPKGEKIMNYKFGPHAKFCMSRDRLEQYNFLVNWVDMLDGY